MLLYPILMGLIQGLTEFLPISSSGHLVILRSFFEGLGEDIFLSVAVHMGTLGAIVTYYRRDIFQLVRGVLSKEEESLQMVGHIFMASLPTAFVGLLIKTQGDGALLHPLVTALGFLMTGLILTSARRAFARRNSFSIKAFGIGYRSAFLVGLAQGLALWPGVSRSGSTIVAGLYMGMSARNAARFSFLISIPAILGAFVWELLETSPTTLVYPDLFVAMGTSFFVGLLAISWTLHLVQSNRISIFAPYTFFLCGCLLVYSLIQFVF